MIPLLQVLGGGGAAMDVTYLTHAVDETDRNAYTFSGLNLGTAAATRHIVVGYYGRAGNPRDISSVTIGGVSATLTPVTTDSTNSVAGFAIAAVPTGATGDVVVTMTGAMLRCGVVLWRVLGAPTVVDSDSTSGSSDVLSLTLTTVSGGHTVAVMSTVNASSGTIAWTGATERFDTYASPFGFSAADVANASTGATVTADFSTGGSVAEVLMALALAPS